MSHPFLDFEDAHSYLGEFAAEQKDLTNTREYNILQKHTGGYYGQSGHRTALG